MSSFFNQKNVTWLKNIIIFLELLIEHFQPNNSIFGPN